MAKSVLPAVGAEGQTHQFPVDRVHFTWDVDNEPVLTIASGDTVVVQTRDVSDNQITPESTAADLDLDWDRVYPLAGPIAVEGAEPGHTLAIAALRFTLDTERSIPAPQYQTAPGPLTPHVDTDGFYGTTGVGPDLYVAAQEAVRAMIDHLSETYDLSREDAYVLSSLCVDLKISEIVDAGQYVVSALLPLAIFRGLGRGD